MNDFVEKNGFELSAYTLHELGHRNPKLHTLKKYAKILGVNWRYLDEGIEEPETPDDLKFINAYDVQAAAGAGKFTAEENVKYKLSFRTEWLKKITSAPADKLALIDVEGDSMEPTLSSCDTVLIDLTQTNHRKDGVYYILYDGYGLIKRIQYNPQEKTVRLISDNAQYTPIDVSDLSAFKIIGRALWVGRKL